MTLANFLHMGGFATAVWYSYGIVTLVLALQMTAVVWRSRQLYKKLSHADR